MAKSDDNAVTPEAAVRLYLLFLEDPSKLVDPAAVKKLEQDVKAAKDPIERLKAISALQRAQAVDGNSFKYDFIKHARRWAEAEGIPMAAFAEMGVPADVLAAAGFEGSAGRKKSSGKAPGAPRRGRMRPEQIEEGVLRLPGAFTVKDIMEHVGGSPATIKGVLDRLMAQERVRSAGERKAEDARGRAARAYEVVGSGLG
ncbi:MAG: hypothetical protein ACKVWR_04960 [Acidimicrobiales bacterium]